MENAILHKEWIKTWRVWVLCLAVSLAMAAYAILRINRLIALKGAEHLWLIMLLKDNSFADVIKWTPLACGLAIALAQMLPEMAQKRLKLTLHLPYPEKRMILTMIGFGMAELFVICLAQATMIAAYDLTVLPSRLVGDVLLTMMPWFAAGFVAYLFAATACIEGRRMRRLLIALIGIVLVMVMFEQSAMAAYGGMAVWILALIAVVMLVLPLGSVIRFKEGLQD